MNLPNLKRFCELSGTVLLRPHHSPEIAAAGDYDFLALDFPKILREVHDVFGEPVVEISRTYVHQLYYEWGQIDILPKLEWNGFEYADVGKVLALSSEDPEGIRRPRLGHDGVISWLTSLLWGGFYKEKYNDLISRAANEDGELMREALEWALGVSWATEMMDWALKGEARESAKHVKSIRRALKWRCLRRSTGDTFYSVSRHWWCELKHHYKPPLPLIAFVGPDGSGKSSVIARVCEQLTQMGLQQKFLHWRPYGLKGREDLGQPVSDPHASPARGWFESFAKLGMLFGDWWLATLTVLRHARAKTSVVISDRYYNDLLVDPIRYRYGAGMGLARRAFRFFPKPDLVFIMVGDADVIYPRKKEVPLNVLRHQLVLYRALGNTIGESAILVDVNRELDEVVDSVFKQVKTFLRDGEIIREKVRKKERQLRVAQFVPHYPSVEGISAYCRGLSKEMNFIEPGSSPVITLRTTLKNLSGDEELLHYPHASQNPMSLPKRLIEDLENDVHQLDGIVFHGAYHPKIGALRRHLTRIGIPYIFVPHDPYVPELTKHHAYRKFVFWHLFEKHTIENAAAVQVLASEHEKPLRDLGFTVPVEVIPNGCELEALDEIPESAKVPGSTEKVRIQYIGRMDRNHKGLDLLISAFARYVEEAKDTTTELVLTGHDWEDRGELEALASKTDAVNQIVFTGPRPEHSLVIHSEADIVVLPSRFDGFGLTIVEGMLTSRPVLVSKRAGSASHVELAGGGWTFEPTVDEICKAIKMAMKDKSRWAEMGILNSKYVANHLTWRQAARRTLKVYRRFFR